MVTFKEKTHQYFNDAGHEYISGTTFLHKFQIPFEKEKFAALKAEKLGITKEEVLRMWKESSVEACKFGTKTHLIMENFIIGKEKNDEHQLLYDSFNAIVAEDFKWAKKVWSEKLLYSDEFRIAGTADLIIEHNELSFVLFSLKYLSKHSSFKSSICFNISSSFLTIESKSLIFASSSFIKEYILSFFAGGMSTVCIS